MDGTGKATWASQNDGNVGGVAVDGGIKARKQGGRLEKGAGNKAVTAWYLYRAAFQVAE